jgi:hypothetical protein
VGQRPQMSPKSSPLHPAGTRVLVVRHLDGGGMSPQLAVLWERGGRDDPRTWRFGLFIWESAPNSSGRRSWQLVYAHRSPRWPVNERCPYADEVAGLTVTDLTRDGHPDVLYGEAMGTGVCGPFRVIAKWDRRFGKSSSIPRAARSIGPRLASSTTRSQPTGGPPTQSVGKFRGCGGTGRR